LRIASRRSLAPSATSRSSQATGLRALSGGRAAWPGRLQPSASAVGRTGWAPHRSAPTREAANAAIYFIDLSSLSFCFSALLSNSQDALVGCCPCARLALHCLLRVMDDCIGNDPGRLGP
jgi:hypothetical protein